MALQCKPTLCCVTCCTSTILCRAGPSTSWLLENLVSSLEMTESFTSQVCSAQWAAANDTCCKHNLLLASCHWHMISLCCVTTSCMNVCIVCMHTHSMVPHHCVPSYSSVAAAAACMS